MPDIEKAEPEIEQSQTPLEDGGPAPLEEWTPIVVQVADKFEASLPFRRIACEGQTAELAVANLIRAYTRLAWGRRFDPDSPRQPQNTSPA